ncbi:laminin subunit alpha-2 [Diorhabda sublineata]|uniref:laminin subunit alpha-2 n=1 Tax=Diorhabda sublineata TaxID=1163346 RepID=UPI0024E0B282|nr:laminin subunit alpha-2 [Diorhabda sublineata]
MQWVVMRGDTSGEPIKGPNIVMMGSNGLKIGCGDEIHTSSKLASQIKLNELNWYHIPNNISDITKVNSNIYHGRSVTRFEFLSILVNVTNILLRSTFHTDQIEALLEEATLDIGEDEYGYSSVERCSCPSGYTGLSCESCSFGYVRIQTNTSVNTEQSFCVKCDCNGHSSTCNPDTGECSCQHNTMGEKCERCAPGFYGNPIRGTSDDCKKCACPLENDENNFSPSCQLDYFVEREEDEGNYVCTQCPKGYTGDHCEICDDGYYGNPMEIGNSCQPCDCNGGPCDRKTGQCLSCRGNTEGWKCEKCKPEHYGEPSHFNCKACECDPIGSVSRQCDNVTGQCECKEKFIGRICSECESGFGNVTALCVPCSCNIIGSTSEICNSHTGICDCKPGVEGFHCDACQNMFYGFSDTGCKPCTCDPDGSIFLTCNQTTGACFCKPHFTGTDCSTCEDNYWRRNNVCTECRCNPYGTIPNTICDKETGKCQCKSGVAGDQCTSCLPDHYGTIQTSCQKCDPCDKKGHICDPKNGKCICPPLASGKYCENCVENTWGYEPGIGCKHCNCSNTGSSSQQCDRMRGTCSCNLGFEGEKCNRCSFGYYDYPNCKKCDCDRNGTHEGQCQNGLCKCDNRGGCKCKQNVEGKYCDRCKENYYGLSIENSKGCTECFCFGRSNTCEDARYHWSKTTRLERDLEEDNRITEDELSLPKAFLGDITASYGGHLIVENSGGYFDVFLEGNNIQISSRNDHSELQMTESGNWRVISKNLDFSNECIDKLTRACFMVIIQNVTFFMIKANTRIKEVLLDKATNEDSEYTLTHSIEKCNCPAQYTGLSCAEPSKGYYRYFSDDPKLSWIDRVIGIAKKCECGGYSEDCDPETGQCKNCVDHRSGPHCDKCEDGFYLDNDNHCKTCLCPSEQQNNAKSCSLERNGGFVCQCKKGYTGPYCDKCDSQYYSPSNSSVCVPCDCNRYGIVAEHFGICDEEGRCQCQEGFKGDKCNQCVKEREYIKDGICKSCDECTMLLFDEIDKMRADVQNVYDMFKNGIGPPWKKLADYLNEHDMLSEKYKNKRDQFDNILKANNIVEYQAKVNDLKERTIKDNEVLEENIKNVDKLNEKSTELVNEANELSKKLINIIDSLKSFGNKHVSLSEALSKAREILKNIQQTSNRIDELNDQKIFYYCANINKKVDEIYGNPPKVPPNNIEDIKNILNALFDLLSYIDNLAKLADAKNTDNSRRLESVKEKFERIKSKNKEITTSFNDIVKKLNGTEDVLEALEIVYKDLVEISDFKEYDELDDKVEKQTQEIPEAQELFDKAVEHVQDLEKKVEEYHSMFNFTKDEWKKINASGAYETIIQGIKEARDSLTQTKEAISQAKNIIVPEGGDSIDTVSNLAQTYSDRLKQRINNLKMISNDFNKIKGKLEELGYSIIENGKANNEVVQNAIKTDKYITSQEEQVARVKKAIKTASEVSERMRDIYKKTDDIAFDKQFNFDKKYQKYQEQIDPKDINRINSEMKAAREALNNLRIPQAPNTSKEKKDSVDKLSNVEKKLKELQNLISLAKQQVDGVDVPINPKNCYMAYQLPKSQYFQSLSITFNCNDCTLFNWTKPSGESLSISVRDNMVTVTIEEEEINVSGIETGENTVSIHKTGSLLKAQVGRQERSKRLQKSRIPMTYINTNDFLELGDKDEVSDSKEISYIYKVILNGETFGVWNFADTNGICKGQKRNVVVDETLDDLFNGKGYLVYEVNTNLNPKQFSVVFEFSTFDENSIIYIAAHFPTCSYFTLYLENGHVHFIIRLKNKEVVELEDTQKVNDGKVHSAEISWKLNQKHSKFDITYTLAVDFNRTSTPPKPINASNVFKLKETKHYLGGVPPTFDQKCIPVHGVPLLGFLKLRSQLTNVNISYGITKAKTLAFTHAWVNEQGYLNLDYPKEVIKTFNYIFRPIKSGTIIKFNDAQSIVLLDSDIILNGEKIDNTNITLDDYNSIELKMGTNKEVIVNGKKQKIFSPEGITITNVQIGGKQGGFVGGIRDIIINDKLIQFENTTIKEFENVEIGREKPVVESNINVKSLMMLNMTNSMQNTERCTEFDDNDIQGDAIKFGDKPNSYTFIKTKFWRTNFTLQFEFRTFYPNGVIFVASNKRKNYILLELKEGQLQLNVEGRKKQAKTLPINSGKINDGQWHHVRLSRKLKKLTVILDRENKPNRINLRIKPKDEIYFGGVDPRSEYTDIPDLKSRLLPFRGCMKSLEINNELQFLTNNKNVLHSNITLCFSKVEEGTYFGGDAYAVYKEDFRITEILELSFEFRTSEQNGMLLSVSNNGDSPALSVELQNGAIVMAVNLGNGITINVTNNLDSDIALCNNRWHNVTALYSNSELTVNVDGIRKSWVQSDPGSAMDDMEAPLYIGGLPDNAPTGTLKTFTNFKGCIRKLKIENQPMDWTDMKELNNVLLNSCPVS